MKALYNIRSLTKRTKAFAVGIGALLLASVAAWLLLGAGNHNARAHDGSSLGSSTTGDPLHVLLEIPEQELPPGVFEPTRAGLEAYEEVRVALAKDDLGAVAAPASRMAAAMEMASSQARELSAELQSVISEARQGARAMAAAASLEAARGAFGEVSRMLMLLVNCDPRLAEGWHAFSCPMVDGFQKWIQPSGELSNPYMGPDMLACGEHTDFGVGPMMSMAEIEAHAEHIHGDPDDIAWYTCSMHPSVRSPDPGQCPICSMTLTPVTRGEATSGVVMVDAERRQRIGVRIEPVRREPLTSSVRAVGKVVYDETRLAEVSVKYQGWIVDLHVNETGQEVRRGQTLFTLYSPELLAAQQELLASLASQRAAAGTSAPGRADYLVAAARQRLRLWDLTAAQVDRIVETGRPVENIPIVSPATGVVVEKHVVAGATVGPGVPLFRIAGLDRVWVEAEIYESDISRIRVGDPASVTLPYMQGATRTGQVAFVLPFLDDATRTARVRIELPNPGLELKPDMYANVSIEHFLGERLTVPEDAILYTGERNFVFVDLGEGRLKPQPVVVGVRSGKRVEILDGLAAGDLVVTSGNFLIAAESRLRLAMEHWGRDDAPETPPRPVDPHAGH
jgi:membrane fusion protein, copper/silver efflux system